MSVKKRGRPPAKNPRRHRVTCYFTGPEIRLVVRAAKGLKCRLSEWVRGAALYGATMGKKPEPEGGK